MQISINIQDDLYSKFVENKVCFNNEIESCKVKLVPFNDGFDELDEFINNVKYHLL